MGYLEFLTSFSDGETMAHDGEAWGSLFPETQ